MSRAPHDGPAYEFNTAPLLEWREPVSPRRFFSAFTVSIAIHVLAFLLYLAAPETEFRVQQFIVRPDLNSAVKIVAPPRIEPLTQRDENKGKVREELDASSALPPAPKPRPFRPQAPLGPKQAPEEGPQIIPEAPQIASDVGVPQLATGPMAGLPAPIDVPPPNIRENIGPSGRDASAIPAPPKAPETPAAGAKAGGGGLGIGSTPGEPSSFADMQLLSDPQGVDFKPYLTRVREIVLRNWLAIIPPAARTGRQGVTVVQFIIDRRGYVPKLVIAQASGTSSYDRAAVAAVSASYPFNPLPRGYNGDEIRLQLAFAYNTNTRR